MNSNDQHLQHDLIGGPFAVIESDPGIFTSLTRRLGIKGLELVELYDIEPWAVDHLKPHGLIFCFLWSKDSHRPTDFDDPAAERVWFANQLSNDACATHAILNAILNCPDIDIGDELRSFKADTLAMSSVMRGLAITNSSVIRSAHNYFARPSDIRASLNNLVITTFEAEKKLAEKKKASEVDSSNMHPPPAKRPKTSNAKPSPKRRAKRRAKGSSDSEHEASSDQSEDVHEEEPEETYHFIGYVPAHGKVWELDGLKSGPFEVGELPHCSASSSSDPNGGWMDTVRPALRMKMDKYGGSGSDGSNIRFSLLAIVDDMYQKAHDEFEFLKRDRRVLERSMDQSAPDWVQNADPSLLQISKHIFTGPPHPPFCSTSALPSTEENLEPFSSNFSARRMQRDMELLSFSHELKIAEWNKCIQAAAAAQARIALEEEITKAARNHTDHVKRTFDYDPFIKEYIRRLHQEGLLNPFLDRDQYGRKVRNKKSAASTK